MKPRESEQIRAVSAQAALGQAQIFLSHLGKVICWKDTVLSREGQDQQCVQVELHPLSGELKQSKGKMML